MFELVERVHYDVYTNFDKTKDRIWRGIVFREEMRVDYFVLKPTLVEWLTNYSVEYSLVFNTPNGSPAVNYERGTSVENKKQLSSFGIIIPNSDNAAFFKLKFI
jgi:hypothetical protein